MPRRLPVAPLAAPAKRSLRLLDDASAVDRRVRPIYCVWEITLACDLACRHCGSRAGRARPDELTTAEAIDVVRQLKELGVLEVTLIGGEAYLRDDWTTIARAIRAAGMECTMTTGGRGITPDRAREAKEAGLQSVSVSVDGLRDTHDQLRAVKGSFDAAMEALKNLGEVGGIALSCNTQINRKSAPEMEELFEVLVGAGMRSWQIQLTTAMGRAGDEEEILLEPWHLLEIHPRLARLALVAKERNVRLFPGNNVGYYGPYEGILRASFPGGHRGSCGAGRSVVALEANGDVKGCPSLPSADYVGGNVREALLKDIWERAPEVRFVRENASRHLYGFCKGCYYADDCHAGCNWTSHVLFGKIGDNPMCHHRALELFEKGERERLVKKEEAPGQPFDHPIFEIVREPFPEAERAAMEAKIATLDARVHAAKVPRHPAMAPSHDEGAAGEN